MSLVYIACVDVGGLHVVKFGVTRHESQRARLEKHAACKDNPFGQKLGPFRDVAAIHTRTFGAACAIEASWKRAARARYPLARDPWEIEGYEIHCLSISGEWLGMRRMCGYARCDHTPLQQSTTVIAFDLGFGLGDCRHAWPLACVVAARVEQLDHEALELGAI